MSWASYARIQMRKANGIKMKKIVCLILVLVCSLSLFACTNSADALIDVVDNSSPTKITTLTFFRAGTDKLEGSFISTIDGENTTLEYSYQYYAPVTADGTDRIATKKGTVQYENGKYSTDGENWFTEAPTGSLTDVGLHLNLKNLGSYELSADGRSLTAYLTNEEAKEVLGVEISAGEDGIELIVDTNGTKITKLTVSYATENAEVVIESSYEYLPKQGSVEE